MKIRYLYIIVGLLAILTACDKDNISPDPDTQIGDPLIIGITRAAGDPTSAPEDDNYGLFAVEHAYNDAAILWSSVVPGNFYMNIENRKGTNNNGELRFEDGSDGKPCRYPINDYLSVFLYYPHTIGATPTSIPVNRTTNSKYPDYIAGTKKISVIAGAPESESTAPNNTIVPLKHLMARVHFAIKNPSVNGIVLTSVVLKNIVWEGTINPISSGSFIPEGGDEDLTLIEAATIAGTPVGQTPIQQYIPVEPKYNYSDIEAAIPSENYYDRDLGLDYYLLVPPLSSEYLANENVALEIKVFANGSENTYNIPLSQPKIQEWEPGKSYCYTIEFNADVIDRIDGIIEPWQEELFIGEVELLIP